jgi:hypothetical protein
MPPKKTFFSDKEFELSELEDEVYLMNPYITQSGFKLMAVIGEDLDSCKDDMYVADGVYSTGLSFPGPRGGKKKSSGFIFFPPYTKLYRVLKDRWDVDLFEKPPKVKDNKQPPLYQYYTPLSDRLQIQPDIQPIKIDDRRICQFLKEVLNKKFCFPYHFDCRPEPEGVFSEYLPKQKGQRLHHRDLFDNFYEGSARYSLFL